MNEEAFNLSLRKLLKHFGVTAQREIEKAVDEATKAGRLRGTESLPARITLRVEGLTPDVEVEGRITLA
jgi:ribosomal protein L1